MEITTLQIDQIRTAMTGIEARVAQVKHIMDSLIEPPALVPPLFKQCDEPWGPTPYSDQSGNTFCFSGCLVTAFASLKAWAFNNDNITYSPDNVARDLNARDAFVGPYFSYPERVGPTMKWYGRALSVYHSPRYEMYETSKVDYTQRPADVELLSNVLRNHPVVALVDYYPHDNDIDTHFVLVYKYIPDPTGGLNDDALIMDSMTGYTSILTYFNPKWYGKWMIDNNISKVARTICGLRIWEPHT